MDSLIIRGGAQLRGTLVASGSKNAALPILAATLLAGEPCSLRRIPHLIDTSTMLTLLRSLGASVSEDHEGAIVVDTRTVKNFRAPYDLVKTMRASILVLGPLLVQHGEAQVSFPGGCAIGSRPIDLHMSVLTQMGARIEVLGGYIVACAPNGLCGVDFCFDTVTVGGTENAIMAAVLARGTTVLRNVAREPEISDLVRFLCAMGAKIEGEGSEVLIIEGVSALNGCDYEIMFDRIEAGTYLVAAAATRGQVKIEGVSPSLISPILDKLSEARAEICVGNDWVSADMRGERPVSVDILTAPFPGFPTDMQAQFSALNAVASGTAKVVETIFENRQMQTHEMNRMGADIVVNGESAVIAGRPSLRGARVMASDLRASASLVIAGLVASGETQIDRIYHIDRGYENIESKLQKLGADIHRISTGSV